MNHSDELDLDRFSRQLLVRGWTAATQRRLQESRVLVPRQWLIVERYLRAAGAVPEFHDQETQDATPRESLSLSLSIPDGGEWRIVSTEGGLETYSSEVLIRETGLPQPLAATRDSGGYVRQAMVAAEAMWVVMQGSSTPA